MPDRPIRLPNGLSCRGEDLLTFISMGKLLTSTVELNEVLALILDRVSSLVPARNWSLLLADEEGGALTFAIVVGEKKEFIRGMTLAPGEGVAGHAALKGEPVLLVNAGDDPRFNSRVDELTGFSTKSIAAIPLKSRGRVVGILEIVNIRDFDAFEAESLPLLTILADYAAVAVQNARYYEKIKQLSVTDEYTGLFNARHLYRVLDQAVEKAEKGGPGFCVVFADVDNFKELVDTFGHMAGSAALKEIGSIMSACLEKGDILAKYGGDEYVMVLFGKGREGVLALCERIRAGFASTPVLADCGGTNVTMSFGLAVYGPDGKTREELLAAADRRMFEVKRNQKDGVGA
ncbi:MAG: sensor domain-containing diguanylate cyclase [Deltaproteobacteria bacterium]|nr:sensor domain-containing diguanylate cyclase [Deltaproteobacteria bacterium]